MVVPVSGIDLPVTAAMMARPGDVRRLALVGRHAERRVALQMLDRVEAFALRQLDIGGGDVVLQVDKGLALAGDVPQRRQRKRLVVGGGRRAGIAIVAAVGRGRGTGGKALAQAGAKRRNRHWPRRRRPFPAARRRARRRRYRRAISAGRDGMRSARPPDSSRPKRRARRPRSGARAAAKRNGDFARRRPCRRRRRSPNR